MHIKIQNKILSRWFIYGAIFCLFLSYASRVYSQESSQAIRIKFFSSPNCRHCIKIKKDFLPEIEKRYKNLIEIEYLDTQKEEDFKQLLSLVKDPKEARIPAVLIGEKLLIGSEQIQEQLPELIDFCLNERSGDSPRGQIDIKKYFSSIGLWMIMGAGFIDGFNPCAFGVIIFFVSFLTLCGYKKETSIYIGIFYILAVYITYLLLGLGLFKFLYLLENFHLFMKIFYFLLAGLCFFLGVLSLLDYFRLKGIDSQNFNVRISPNLEKFVSKFSACSIKAHNLIRKYFQPQESLNIFGKIRLMLVALFVGFCVSILECACTGQVYLPTISLCLKIPSLRVRSFLYLLLYNAMFIFPLLLVFIFALKGASSEKFSNFIQRHNKLIRLLLAALFIFLGFMIIIF